MEYVIKIKGRTYTQVLDYEPSYNQLWAEGSGRNYGDFEWNGTLAGNFDQVRLGIVPKSRLELSNLIKDLRSGIFTIEYYCHEIMAMKTATVYRANFSVKTIYVSETETYTEAVALSFTLTKREPQ